MHDLSLLTRVKAYVRLPFTSWQRPIISICWGHRDSRLLMASGPALYVVRVEHRVSSLQLLCQQAIASALREDKDVSKLTLPPRLCSYLSTAFIPTIKVEPSYLPHLLPPSSSPLQRGGQRQGRGGESQSSSTEVRSAPTGLGWEVCGSAASARPSTHASPSVCPPEIGLVWWTSAFSWQRQDSELDVILMISCLTHSWLPGRCCHYSHLRKQETCS